MVRNGTITTANNRNDTMDEARKEYTGKDWETRIRNLRDRLITEVME
jgi:hypothetical protein